MQGTTMQWLRKLFNGKTDQPIAYQSSASDELSFEINGSTGASYRIVAKGTGQELQINCSCPAGTRGRNMCKHVAYLLAGEITHLASTNTQDVYELVARAEGSEYTQKSDQRISRDLAQQEDLAEKTIHEYFETHHGDLEALGWVVLYEKSENIYETETVSLYRKFKNGKVRKRPTVWLTYEKFTFPEGCPYEEIEARNVDSLIPKQRKWTLHSSEKYHGSWGKSWKALEKFLEEAQNQAPFSK